MLASSYMVALWIVKYMKEFLSFVHASPRFMYVNLMHKKNRRWLSFMILGLFILFYFVFYSHSKININTQPTAVVMAKVCKKDVPVYVSALGSVTATYTVTVKTQINGLLMKVLYNEGQMVKKGDLLVVIDDRLLHAQLIEYQGQLIRDQALLDNALIDLKRYQTLWKQDSISQQTFETQKYLVKQYQGTVEMDKGLIETTQVNLIYCRITSPIDGRIGLRLVDPGNFVQTSDTTGIAVITTLDPITVIFSIPEDNIPDVLSQAYENKKMQVLAYDREGSTLLATGGLITIDNQISTSTGTVNLRAKFSNKKNRLFSNQFVNIQILVKTLHNAIVVPTAAIQHDSVNDFVYRLNVDSTVSIQWVKAGVTTGDFTVINKGLLPGQRVVTEGVDRLADGAKVNVL